MYPRTLAKRLLFFYVLTFSAFYLYGLGHFPLVGPDEPRYAQVAREMLLRHDLITPTLGGHPWFEKPALLYWLMIAAYRVFGVNEWSARLGPAVCGLLTIAAVWLLARTVERISSECKDLARWTLLVASSCLGVIVFSRGASFDIVITMTTAWALTFFWRSQVEDNQGNRIRWLIGFYVFVGLSLLAKGLVGLVIPSGAIGLYYLLRRSWPDRATWLSMLWGLPITLLVAGVWYGPVIYRHGWPFIEDFFVQHHFARFVSNKYHHPQPLYFYPPILLMLAMPWTPFLIDALADARRWSWRSKDHLSSLLVFSFAWILFPVLFFSASRSKLPGYILPVLPAALILIGMSVVRFRVRLTGTWPIRATGALLLLTGLIGFRYGLKVEHLSLVCTTMAAAPFIASGIVAIVWITKPSHALTAIALSVMVAVVVMLNCAAPTISQRESTKALLALADARGYSHLRVLAIRGDDRSAEFYASGRVIYGNDGEVLTWYEAPALISDTRKNGEKLLAFVSITDLEFLKGKPGVEIIGDNGKYALVCFY